MGKQHPVGYLSCVLTYVRTRKGKGGVSCDVRIVHRARHYNWDDIKREFEGITRLVSYYELKEATTTFELALWKSQLDQAGASNNRNRSAYRIEAPGPVKDTIMQYL